MFTTKIIIPIVLIAFNLLIKQTRTDDTVEELVEYYENLIADRVESAYTYEYEEDAKRYEAANTTISGRYVIWDDISNCSL